MKKLLHILISFILTITTHLTHAGAPQPDLDDNGNASFVRQVVPKLLGRKPRGNEEVHLLKDIASLYGREALVRALMQQPEFQIHWSRILTDHLKTQRESSRAQSQQCFSDPETTLDNSDVDASLAEFIRDNPITSDFDQSFNMTQLLISSIQADNLFPAYRGNLYALGAHPPGSSMRSAEEVRAEVGIHFDDVYLNRDLNCISCHRGTYSTTGIGDRTHPLYKTLELALFDYTGIGEITNVENPSYQDYCSACHGEDGNDGNPVRDLSADRIAEVLNSPGSGMNSEPARAIWGGILNEPDVDQIIEDMAVALGGPFGAEYAGETTRRHFASFRPDLFDNSISLDEEANSSGGWGPWDMDKQCAEIHGFPADPAIPAYFAGFASDFATVADIDEKLTAGYYALPSALPGMAANDDSGNIPGDIAAAYLVAASITQNVWETLMGEPLTLINRFARNSDQRNLHKHLTEEVFISNDWSLKELIVEIVKLNYFNRSAPVSSMAIAPYSIEPVYEPFAQTTMACAIGRERDEDGRNDPNDSWTSTDGLQWDGSNSGGHGIRHVGGLATLCPSNGQGDAVHRYAPTTLLNAIASALDWPSPKMFPDNQYPSVSFAKSIGQYISDFDTGDKDVGFQGLLSWDNQVGTGDKPDNAADIDWVDRLHTSIDAFNSENPGAPLTLGELVLTIKDWIIQEPVFGGYRAPSHDSGWEAADDIVFGGAYEPTLSEAQLVSNFFDGAALNDPVESKSVSKLKLRELVGVYAKTPQFMLAGIIRNDSFTSPRFRVCNEGACDYKSMCLEFEPAFDAIGHGIVCNSDSVDEPLDIGLKTKTCRECGGGNEVGLLSGISKLLRIK